MKTVAILYDHTLDIGGVESHLLGLLRQVPADKYRFVLISQTSESFAAKAGSLGARVIGYSRWNGLDPRSSLGLAKLFKDEKIDLVHAHSPVAALSGRLAASWCGLPAVVTVHLPVTQYHGLRQTWSARLGRWLYTLLDRWLNFAATACLVYVSQRVRDQCVGSRLSPPSRSVVIPVGIPLEKYFQASDRQSFRQEAGARPDAFIMTFVGRLDEQKGVDILLDAAAQVLPGMECARLWIIGDGPLQAELVDRAHALNLGSSVRFWSQQEMIAPFLAASDLFILPSRFEAMPISLLEALASGLPVVVTRVGENETLVQDGVNGIIVPPGDVNALAQALNQLAGSPELRQQLSKTARQTAERFDERFTARQLVEIYDKVCSVSGHFS